MIVSFATLETESIWKGEVVKSLPISIQESTRRKLRIINNSVDLNDLQIHPALQLEKMSGDFKHFYNVVINNQWGILFKWSLGKATEVEIVDYR